MAERARVQVGVADLVRMPRTVFGKWGLILMDLGGPHFRGDRIYRDITVL